MPDIYCQDCSARLRVPETAHGRTIQCSKCSLVFTIHLNPSERDERPDREERDDLARRAASSDADWDRYSRRRPRRRKEKKSSSSLPLIIGSVVFGIALVVVLTIVLVNFLGSSIDDSKWQLFEDPNRFKVQMPGTPKRQTFDGGVIGHMLEYNRFTVFLAGYTEPIPAQRLQGGAENLFNEFADAYIREISKDTPAVEKRRGPVQLGRYPGKEIVAALPKNHLTVTVRCYLAGDRLYLLCAVGRGFDPENPAVKRFFDSFEVTESGVKVRPAEPAPRPEPAPKVERPLPPKREPVAPPPPSGDPAQTALSAEKADPTVLIQKDADEKLVTPGDTVYLNDMTEFGWLSGPLGYVLGKDGLLGKRSAPKLRAVVKGQALEKSLCQRTPMPPKFSRLAYSLGEKASKLSGAVAISEDGVGVPPKSTRFLILGDGVVLWRSNFIREFGVVEKFQLDVSSVNILELRVVAEPKNNGASAVWIEPQVKVKE